MSKIVEGLFYSKSHEWVKPLEDDVVLIGITDFAQSELGDVVFVDLPETGDLNFLTKTLMKTGF
jgi:glycine cleavage system H protein